MAFRWRKLADRGTRISFRLFSGSWLKSECQARSWAEGEWNHSRFLERK